jgi:hypothetical protein
MILDALEFFARKPARDVLVDDLVDRLVKFLRILRIGQ